MRKPAATAAAREAPIRAPVYPVILCGGSGQRLWPASRPWRPKAFLALVGEESGFQAAVLRARPLVIDGGGLIVVGGEQHAGLIAHQLAELGIEATVLLEPVGRDTAPAIAAAAAWVAREAPEAILAILPADHHIPDAEAFRAAVRVALPAASHGAIVTLGLRPTGPLSAYGYIRPGPGEEPVRPIAAFVEKPQAEAAAALMAQGALWNIGVFVATARTLGEEAVRWAPALAAVATAAVGDAVQDGAVVRLAPAFASATEAAFDRAVMEQTDHGAVLAVDFAWSDLGAWDAVAAAAGQRVLVRAAPGVRVAVVGLTDIAVVVEPDAVLVTALTHSQAVRDVASSEGPPRRYPSLADAARASDLWLRTAALPLWATVGVDPATGAFREALTCDGVPDDPWRRARVQARQTFVFASAAADGLDGPWSAVARAGFAAFRARARLGTGLFAARLELDGTRGASAGLYDHAFVLLALAGLSRAAAGDHALEAEAVELLGRLQIFRHAAGFREVEPHPFQANAHMHLLEAALTWEGAGGQAVWGALADEIAGLALSRFIDPASGVLREFFDAQWRPLPGEAGLIEPGHQFEWAWLLERWGVARGEARARAASRRLFEAGRRGFDPARGVIVNALWADFGVRDAGARLWPQTEHLKAALALGETSAALEAANGLAIFLDTPARGVWRERMRPDGGFVEQAAPATSLYHLYLAIRELAAEPC